MLDFTGTVTLVTRSALPDDLLQHLARLAATTVRAQIAAQFATQGAQFGPGWAPLASGRPATLIRSGNLIRSLLDPNDPNAIDEPGDEPGTWKIGSTLPYAPYIHFGTRFSPARAILPQGARISDPGLTTTISGNL